MQATEDANRDFAKSNIGTATKLQSVFQFAAPLMTTPDPGADVAASAYLNHLGAVQHQLGVVAADDILNDKGQLLARKGTALTEATVSRLNQHRLARPVDELTTVQHSLTAKDIHNAIEQMLARHPHWLQLHHANQGADELRHCCFVRSLPYQLMNRLSVMALRLPLAFERALFVAWFAVLLGRELKLAGAGREGAFVAGLFHDCGLVHITPALASKRGEFSAAEWREFAQHSAIGANMVAATGWYDDTVTAAVRDHHERSDGSGFARGLADTQVSSCSQIIALADILHSLLTVQLPTHHRGLLNALTYLRMNPHGHGFTVYQAAMKVISRAGLQAPPSGDTRLLLERQRDKPLQMGVLMACLLEIQNQCAEFTSGPGLRVMLQLIEQTLDGLQHSGLLSGEVALWLGHLDNEPMDEGLDRELGEIEAMHYEVHWRVHRICRQLRRLLDGELKPDHPQRPAVLKLLEGLERRLQFSTAER